MAEWHNKKVKELFDEFEDTDDFQEKKGIALNACQELKIHSKLEEEIFYPAAKAVVEDDERRAPGALRAHDEGRAARLLPRHGSAARRRFRDLRPGLRPRQDHLL